MRFLYITTIAGNELPKFGFYFRYYIFIFICDDDETNSKKFSNLVKKPERDDVKFIKHYQKLRAEALACVPQKFVPKDKCKKCSCLLPGVLLCTKKTCLSNTKPAEKRKHRLLNGVVFN